MSHLIVFAQRLAVCRLDPDMDIPSWVQRDGFSVIARTPDELTVVCEERWVPGHIKAEKGWRLLKVQGPLDFSQVGILAAIIVPLAQAGVSIFTISTFDTDYILVKEVNLEIALDALQKAKHFVEVS